MTDEKIRLKCLKIAAKMTREYESHIDTVRRAGELVAFVRPPVKAVLAEIVSE